MLNEGSVEFPAVKVSVFTELPVDDDQIDRVVSEMAFRYDLYSDLSEFYNGFQDDELLSPVIERWRGVRPSSYSSLYEYLVTATILQNTNIRRTVQMAGNLFDRFGFQLAFDEQILSAFWDPQTIRDADEQELRQIKLGYRAKALSGRLIYSGRKD